MADNDQIHPRNIESINSHVAGGMNEEARAYRNETRSEEDEGDGGYADEGEYVYIESHGDPMDDLPEMEIVMKSIYDL